MRTFIAALPSSMTRTQALSPANMTIFNYLRPPPPLHPTPPISYISVQNYKICIRSEQGACYAEFRSDTNQFHLEPVGQPKKSGNSDTRSFF